MNPIEKALGLSYLVLGVSFLGLLLYQLNWSITWWICERRLKVVSKGLNDLYDRRTERVRKALARGTIFSDPQPIKEGYAYDGWVELLAGGKLKIAGDVVDATQGPFTITARDEFRHPRAEVIGNGQGVLLISSHGVRYHASWDGSAWNVRNLDTENPNSLP